MSWSVSFIGKPENVAEALANYSEKAKLSGASKEEYEEALPHIQGLLAMNYSDQYPFVIKVDASGHAYKDGKNNYSNCNVAINSPGGQLV